MVAGAARLCFLCNRETCTWTRAPFQPSRSLCSSLGAPSPSHLLSSGPDKPTDNATCADRAVKGLLAWEYRSGPAMDLQQPPISFQTARRRSAPMEMGSRWFGSLSAESIITFPRIFTPSRVPFYVSDRLTVRWELIFLVILFRFFAEEFSDLRRVKG